MAKSDSGAQVKRKGRIVRGAGRTLLDLPTWFSLEYLKSANKSIFTLIKESFSFSKQKDGRSEDFALAMQRQGVTEADLQERVAAYQRNMFMMGGFGGLIACYALYLLFTGSFLGFVVGVIVSALSCVKAYQFSLWNFQIKHRKLGCTFQEWRAGKVFSSAVTDADNSK